MGLPFTRPYCDTYTPWCFPSPGRGFNGCSGPVHYCTWQLTESGVGWCFILFFIAAYLYAWFFPYTPAKPSDQSVIGHVTIDGRVYNITDITIKS